MASTHTIGRRRGTWWFLVLIFVVCWTGDLQAAATSFVIVKGHPAHATRILAKYAGDARPQSVAEMLPAQGLAVSEQYSLVPGLVMLDVLPPAITAASEASAEMTPKVQAQRLIERINALSRSGWFAYVEPDYLVHADVLPNDAAFTNGTLWGLNNTGQNGGLAGTDIGAPAAWDITTGSTNVIVAIIDSGIRYSHKDLFSQMWRNPNETPLNGADDDGNGYADDIFGMNAIEDNGDPLDDYGHGTHVAGIIGAAAKNGQPHVGVAWNVRLMACKFLDDSGGGKTSDAIKAIQYAVANHAAILNLSYGSSRFSQAEMDALEAAGKQGVLVVASAGNENADNDQIAHYPSSYPLPNLISVAAINRYNRLSSFSNFGQTTVHLGAPGEQIFSCYNGSDTDYKILDGASMAAPFVSGTAALLLARYPGLSVNELATLILSTVAPAPALQKRTITGGRLDAYNALSAKPTGTLSATITPNTEVILAAGDLVVFQVRVTDLFGVTNANVQGTLNDGDTVPFTNNAIDPGDVYSAQVRVPETGSQLQLSLSLSAPDKAPLARVLDYRVVKPPTNDFFANRVSLAGENASATAVNRWATREAGEPNHGNAASGRSLWWSWTAPRSGWVTLDTVGSKFDTILSVYTGRLVSALTLVSENDDISSSEIRSRVTFGATVGTTYQIAVDGCHGEAGELVLNLALGQSLNPPMNDNFAQRLALTGTNLTLSATNHWATKEYGEPAHAGSVGGRSVWWRWSTPVAGRVTLATVGSDFDTLLAVYVGSAVTNLALIADNDDAAAGESGSRLQFDALPNVEYAIAVDGFAGEAGRIQLSLALTQPVIPPNDAFEQRTSLVGTNVTVQAHNDEATREPGEPRLAGNSGGKSLWWTWTAPGNGRVTLATAGSDFDTLLGVYTGPALSSLVLVAANNDISLEDRSSLVQFEAQAGVDYQIAVDGYYSIQGFTAFGNLTLHLSWVAAAPKPANDLFTDRTHLEGHSFRLTGANAGATRENGEPNHAGKIGGASVWWTWTASAPGKYTLSTAGSTFDTLLAVYTGNTMDNLIVVAANDDDPNGGFTSRVTFEAISGVAYHFVLDGFGGATGDYILALSLGMAPPVNDRFANPTVILNATNVMRASNEAATREPGEPFHAGNQGGASVWWSWTAPDTGPVTLSTVGSDFDTVMGVYIGSSLRSLKVIAFGDDDGNLPTSRVDFTAQAGTNYLIAVDGFDGAVGNLKLTLSQTPIATVTNDFFGHRLTLFGDHLKISSFNVGATKEPGEPNHASYPGGRSIWWSWTAPQDGQAVLSTEGSDFDTLLAVYTGDTLANLSLVTANDDADDVVTTSRVKFNAKAGTVYQIAADGFSSQFIKVQSGHLVLTLDLSDPIAIPANDNFANATMMTGMNWLATGSNEAASREEGEPLHAGKLGDKSLWWSWTAPDNGNYLVQTLGSDFDTMLAVYTGSDLPHLRAVICNDDDPQLGMASRVHLEARAGTTYRIAVDGYIGFSGNYCLSLQPDRVSTPIYQACFEPEEGFILGVDLSRQSGWTGSGSGGNQLTNNFFPNQGWQALIGLVSGGTNTGGWAWPQTAYTPTTNDERTTSFAVEFKIMDSSNRSYDDFAWRVSDADGSLVTLLFDNDEMNVYYQSADTERASTLVEFENNHYYDLRLTLDFARQTWTAQLNDKILATAKPLPARPGGWKPVTIAAGWAPHNPAQPGDNFMVFDQYRFSEKERPTLSITSAPEGQEALAGNDVVLKVAASGSEPIYYQWRFNGANLPGQTNNTLVLRRVEARDTGTYLVLAYNLISASLSPPARLIVIDSASIRLDSAQPPAGGPFQFLVHGPPGWNLQIEASTNFLNWTVLSNLTNPSGTVPFTDPNATDQPWRFYRAVAE